MQRSIAFGTDGVRGVANEGLLPEDATRLGLAAAGYFGGPILIGRDTRLSGEMLSAALAAGSASGGASVIDAGVLPTPGIAALAPRLGAAVAGVVSASHNPYPDNGIKFFSGEGRKLAAARGKRDRVPHRAPGRRAPHRGRGRRRAETRRRREALRRGHPRAAAPARGGYAGTLRLRERGRLRGRSAGLLGAWRRPHGRWGRAGRGEHKRGRRLHARRGSRRLGLRRRLRLRWGRGQGARQGREGQRGRRGQDSRHPGAGPQGARGARRRRDSHANEQPRLLQGDGVPRHPLRRHPRGRQARGRGDARAWGFARRGAVRARDPLRSS